MIITISFLHSFQKHPFQKNKKSPYMEELMN